MTEKTDVFPADIKPVRVGWYETQFYDVCWLIDLRVWFDGEKWKDSPEGWALIDQNVSWRGLNEQC